MIKLITDSASDIPREDREKYNITIMSVPINVDGVEYHEGVDFTSEEYYDILVNAKAIPTHAQVTMMEFSKVFRDAIREGYNQIVCVTITSKGSGIYDAACLAKKLLFEESPELTTDVQIEVVDSKGYTWVYGQALVAAGQAILAGKDYNNVLQVLHTHLDGYFAAVGLTNLTYAKKSGRITTVAAFVGEVLGFRPILTLEGGELLTKSKVRGDSKLVEGLVEVYQKNAAEDGRPYYIICADSMDNAKLLHKAIEKITKNPFGGFYRIGPSVVTNSGPTIFGFVMPVPIQK